MPLHKHPQQLLVTPGAAPTVIVTGAPVIAAVHVCPPAAEGVKSGLGIYVILGLPG